MGTVLPNSLRHVLDEQGRDTGFCFVREPVRAEHMPVFHALAKDHRMVGLCSFGPFPLFHEGYRDFWELPGETVPEEGWNRPFIEACEAWCHCFREPDRFLPPGRPRLLFSNSDFTDIERIRAAALPSGPVGKRWDVVYSCLGHRLYEFQKDWDTAKACLRRLCGDLGLRVLVVGRADSADLPDLPGLEVLESLPLPWDEFLQYVARARVVMLPHRFDASPRALPEALAMDVPVLVRRGILGGWKYVTPETGEFFDDEGDVVQAAWRVLTGTYTPSAWLSRNYGRRRAEARLADFLRGLPGGEGLKAAHVHITGAL
ncbi:hypothetical protein GCM10010191_73460 [Actinomadura vinacea]|uniref:Glycosyltransferase n=1 Tax=Actinomadura vinacea TaxID=115336 RepID=A0ABN3K3L9_9ACTN